MVVKQSLYLSYLIIEVNNESLDIMLERHDRSGLGVTQPMGPLKYQSEASYSKQNVALMAWQQI